MTSNPISPPQSFREFIAWEVISQDTIDFKKIYVDMAGDLKAGLLLSQIIYWRLPSKKGAETKLTIQRDNRLWLAKADKDWWSEVRLTAIEARGARQILMERGLIDCKTWKWAGETVTHISINEPAFLEVLGEIQAVPEEARNAGRIERVKRAGPKKPGSKPASGNRGPRPKQEARTEEAETPTEESGNYGNHNSGITETIIPELRKPQFPNYENHKAGIMVSSTPYTESTPESPSETPAKSGGGHSFTETARAEAQPESPAHPVAVIEPPAPTTTEGAALEQPTTQALSQTPTDEPAGASGEATPDGEDFVTDQDLEMLFGSRDENAEDLEKVPGGAAAGRAALSSLMAALPEGGVADGATPASVNILTPVSEAELLGRPAAEPGQAIYKTIVGFVGGKKVIEEGILDAFTPTGGVPRRYWLRLTADELDLIRRTAQVETKATQTSFITLCILGMDRLIGAPQKGKKASSGVQTGGGAYATKTPGALKAELPDEPSKFVAGSEWRNKASGTVLILQDTVATRNRNGEGMAYLMSDGKTVTPLDLMLKFEAI